jgi:hypothetical protein
MYLTQQQATTTDDDAMFHLEVARDLSIDGAMGLGSDDDAALADYHTDRANYLWWLVDFLTNKR